MSGKRKRDHSSWMRDSKKSRFAGGGRKNWGVKGEPSAYYGNQRSAWAQQASMIQAAPQAKAAVIASMHDMAMVSPIKPEMVEVLPEKEEKKPDPIPPLQPVFAHTNFWHRSIGSVFPIIPETHFATSCCSNIPPKFLPKPPTNRCQMKFSPRTNMFRSKFLPPKPRKATNGATTKVNKPLELLTVYSSPHTTENVQAICEKWKHKLTSRIRVLDAMSNVEEGLAARLCRDTGLWFGQWCLVCERELSHKSIEAHFKGKAHYRKYVSQPVKVLYDRVNPTFVPSSNYLFSEPTADYVKPFPFFGRIHHGCNVGSFLKSMGFNHGEAKKRILICGDFDLTFSLGINRATAYKMDITSVPIRCQKDHPRILRNMQTCEKFKIKIMHDVDLYDPTTFKFDQPFDKVFFLFPQVSFLTNLADPLNSRFLQDVFRIVNKNSIIRPDGHLYLLLKRQQFVDWDLCTVALQEKLFLQRAVFHHANAFHPFEPKEDGINGKIRKLSGTKTPLYYVFARTKQRGFCGMNPWTEKQPTPEPETKGGTREVQDADKMLQQIESQFKAKKPKH